MADLKKTVEVIFAGTDDLSGVMRRIGVGMQDLEGNLGSVTSPMEDWTRNILAAETAVVAFGVTMAGVAINQAGQFSTSVAEIGTLFNGTTEQVDGLKSEILDYARNSTQSIDAINGAVYQAISTGTDWADSIELVAAAETLATAGRADLQSVTELLTGSMNAYGASVDQAADYSDVLFAAVQTGATNIPELSANLSKVTSVASAAGVPFDQLVATLSTLTLTQGSTAESATKLKALLTELIKPSDSLSLALGDVSLRGDGLQAVMLQLMQSTGGSAEEMSKLFGSTEALQAALALVNDPGGKFVEILGKMAERAGVAGDAAAAMAKEFENINQNLLNNIQVAFTEAGLPLLDSYGEAAGALAEVFKSLSFEFRGDAFKPLYDAADEAAETITETLQGIAKALPEALEGVDFEGLLAAFDGLGTEIAALFGGLDLTKPEDLKVAIQAIIDTVTTLTNLSAGAVSGLKPFIQGLAAMIDGANALGQDLKELVGQLLGLATGLNHLLPVLGAAGGALTLFAGAKGMAGAASSISTILPLLMNPVTGLIAGFGLLVAVAPNVYDLSRSLLGLETSTDAAQRRAKEMADQLVQLQKALNGDAEALAAADEQTKQLVETKAWFADSEKRIAEQVAFSNKSYEEQVQILFNSSVAQQNLNKVNEEGAKAQAELREWHIQNAKALASLTEEQIEALSVEQRRTLEHSKQIATENNWLTTTEKQTEATHELTDAQVKAQLSAKELADVRLKELEIMTDARLELEALASNERLKHMEFTFDLQVEQLKSDAERAIAIIDGLSDSIGVTAGLLSDLFGYFLEADNISERWYIQDQIELENERRQQQLDLQKELTEKQIDLMDAQIANLESGDGLIKIQADGLEPEIRAFMYRILDNIRIEMSRDNLAFITGVQN
ncbi:phage tail tape measure protein [Marinobacterium sp. D7]|uniref:phage tail tape measure protein n=1 Tax=Marinobacterium ramblicola TaxID=2849041 RepID=UPI001C2D9CAD|nr:phage tail tape measure protein [Marinobacterium ramblicola]MBV1788625.1 phage tail tape measure protein [Marinobacterium ramblicola]